ncbi:MAG: cytochrome-c peroxidase [Planctomycetota bacterium]|jgi:cytochrome c peroxidase
MRSLIVLALAGWAYAQPAPVADRDFHDDGKPDSAKVELGRMLFFDKILSGNKNISCATCHHPRLATADGVALGFGEGAHGLGPKRRPGKTHESAIHERVPRNSPALFNLGAREYTVFFHDGRVEVDTNGYYEGGFITPAKWKLPKGLDSALAAQAMFPVTSPTEMAGQKGENKVADARALNNVSGRNGVWDRLAKRLRANRGYRKLFARAYPKRKITFVLAANAIAAFEATAFRADRSRFDRHLRGQDVLSDEAKAGMELFYGRANCASCHSGKFQTDHGFHAIAMPQIGPGKGDGRDGAYWRATGLQAFVEDYGRERVTGRARDRFKFRTPSLRNVELTGPWGHAGTHTTLESVIRHHARPVESLHAYNPAAGLLQPIEQVAQLSGSGDRLKHTFLSDRRRAGFLRRDTWVQLHDPLRESIAQANELRPATLTDREIEQLVAFLKSLTDPRSRDLVHLVPARVPSGLPVKD